MIIKAKPITYYRIRGYSGHHHPKGIVMGTKSEIKTTFSREPFSW